VSSDIQALRHNNIYEESSPILSLIQTHEKLPLGCLKLNFASFLFGHTACVVSVFFFKERGLTLLITLLSVYALYATGSHSNPVHSNYLWQMITAWRKHEFAM
jgi:hypothetical protein